MAEEIINIQIVEEVENITISIQEPSKTSDLINDGADGVHPFITSAQTINDASSTVKGILKLTNDLGGTADLPTVPGLTNKVDKIIGKGLSTNDYTTAEQTKLAGIQAGAEININADWNATIGDAVIFNKPSIPSITGLVPYTGATTDVDLGGKMLQTSKLKLYDMASGGDEIASIEYTDEAFIVKNSDGEVLFHIENGFIQLHNGSTIQSNLFTTLLTQVRDHYLPDKSGTIALTSDITGINSGTNTGDETATTIKSKLGITTLSGSNTGDNSTNTQYSGLATSKEDVANKSTSVTTDQSSNIKYPSVKSVYDWAVGVFTTTSAVATQITTALTGYATQAYVNGQGFITNVITALGYTPLNKAGDTITGDFGNTSTGYFRLPNGTTTQRPGTPLNGMHRYNTDTLRDEFYANGSWQNHARLTGDTFTGAISATNLSGTNTGNETSSTIATALGYTPASQDGTILYHSVVWFTPTGTVSSSGTTVTSVGTQFTSSPSMVGAKLIISGETRIITAFISTTQVTVASAYSQNYSGVAAGSWGVYSKAYETTNGGIYYSTLGIAWLTNNNNYLGSSGILSGGAGFFLQYAQFDLLNSYVLRWSSTNRYDGTKDVGLARNSAGLLEIYDGTATGGALANRRDLLVRNVLASQNFQTQPTPTAISATSTLTIANLLTNIINVTSSVVVTLTLPTGTLTDAGVLAGALPINTGFDWTIINTGSSLGVITLAAGTGHTIVGSATIALGASATFRTVKTATNTFITYTIA